MRINYLGMSLGRKGDGGEDGGEAPTFLSIEGMNWRAKRLLIRRHERVLIIDVGDRLGVCCGIGFLVKAEGREYGDKIASDPLSGFGRQTHGRNARAS
jgi:hypothetical protein